MNMNKKNVGIGVGILAGLGAAIGSFLAIRHCKKKREEALIDDFFDDEPNAWVGDDLTHIKPFGQSTPVRAMGFGKVEPACKCDCCGKAFCEPTNDGWEDDDCDDGWGNAAPDNWGEVLEPIEPQGDVVKPMDEATSSESDDTEDDDFF